MTLDMLHMVRGEHSIKIVSPQLLRFGIGVILVDILTNHDLLNT